MKPQDTPDPHLGQALAHAPDRDVRPPAHLSAQILAAAHREAACSPTKSTPRAMPWWRRPWGASGALAAVLMAGFLGLLWRGEPPGPAVDEPVPAAPAQATAPEKNAETQAGVQAVAPSRVLPRALGDTAQTRAEQKVVRQRQAAESARADKPVHAMADTQAAKEGATAPVVVAAAPPPLPAPAPARAAALRVAPPTAGLSAPAVLALPTWQPGDHLQWRTETAQGVPGADWLQRLTALTQGLWAPASAATSPPLQLSWQRGGGPLGTLHWSSAEVWWCAAGQGCLRAEVPEQAWRSLLGQPASGR